MQRAELRGRTVVVTRAEGQSSELRRAFEETGATVVELPTIEIRPPDSYGDLDRALAAIDRYEMLILGSKNAADAVAERARVTGTRIGVPIACVGAKTRAHVEALATRDPQLLSGRVLAPEDYRAEALVEAILRDLEVRGENPREKRFLCPRAPEGREVVIEALTSRGAEVDAPIAYRIACAPPASIEMLARLEGANVFTFLSGETLRCFLQVVPEERARRLLARAVVSVIGPIAKARAEALGVRVDIMPEVATAEALVEAVCAFRGRPAGAVDTD